MPPAVNGAAGAAVVTVRAFHFHLPASEKQTLKLTDQKVPCFLNSGRIIFRDVKWPLAFNTQTIRAQWHTPSFLTGYIKTHWDRELSKSSWPPLPHPIPLRTQTRRDFQNIYSPISHFHKCLQDCYSSLQNAAWIKAQAARKRQKKEGGEKVSESDMEDQISHCLEMKYERWMHEHRRKHSWLNTASSLPLWKSSSANAAVIPLISCKQ